MFAVLGTSVTYNLSFLNDHAVSSPIPHYFQWYVASWFLGSLEVAAVLETSCFTQNICAMFPNTGSRTAHLGLSAFKVVLPRGCWTFFPQGFIGQTLIGIFTPTC